MNEHLNKLYYSERGWLCIKLFLSFHWLIEMIYMVVTANAIYIPAGVCIIIPCDWMQSLTAKSIVVITSLVALYFYLVSQKHQIITLSALFILSLLIISSHESSGVFLRANLYSMVWFGQLAAAALYRNNLEHLSKFRHQFVVQIIGATYLLAAISKLQDAGWDWPAQGAEYISINGLKGYYFDYFNDGDSHRLKAGMSIAYSLLEKKEIVYWLLSGALVLELAAPLAAINAKTTFLFGIALFLMHQGIDYSMNITIGGTYFTMLAFMLNPLGILYFLYQSFARKFRSRALSSPTQQ